MEQKISYRNIEIFYTIYGSGETIVLLHGFLNDSTIWDWYVKQLSQTHTVICIDAFGHGESECLLGPYSFYEMAAVVYYILQENEIEKALFFGHSMGGYIALHFAKLYPKNISGLVLLNSHGFRDTPARVKQRIQMIKLVQRDYDLFLKIVIPPLFCDVKKFSNEIELLKKMALKISPDVIVKTLEILMNRENRIDIFENTNFQKLIILGSKDKLIQTHKILNVKLPYTQMEVLQTGHMGLLENRDETFNLIQKFIKKIDW